MTDYSAFYGGYGASPGINTPVGTVENSFYWDKHYLNVFDGGQLDSTSVDSGNGDTAVLRPGLLLGRIYSSGNFVHWNPVATDGSQYIAGILDNPAQGMKDSRGTAKSRWRGSIMVRGCVKPTRLLIPGQTAFGIVGNAYEYVIRAQLANRGFLIQENPQTDLVFAGSRFLGGYNAISAKTADYTVKAYESGTLFTNRGATGAVNFTLPNTVYQGLSFGFYAAANQNLKVTAATGDTMVAFNDAAADSVSYETASEKIGGAFDVISDGTGWLVFPRLFSQGGTAQTVTVAT